MKANNATNWTYSEQYAMANYYASEGTDITARLNGKTKAQVKRYASRMGLRYINPMKKNTVPTRSITITRNYWSLRDDEILAAQYPTRTAEDIRQMLNGKHTACAIRQRANKNGIYKKNRRRPNPWTFEEFVIISAFYPTEGKNVVRRLKNRTMRDVMQFAARKGIRSMAARGNHVTEVEMKIFAEFKDKGAKYCANLTGRSLSTVRKWIKVIEAMEPSNTATTWSESDTEYLAANYVIESTEALAKKLNRTEKAIRNKASAMGLSKKSNQVVE